MSGSAALAALAALAAPRAPSALRALASLLVLVVSGCASSHSPPISFVAPQPGMPRTLLVVLDAVPFAPVERAASDEQLFDDLEDPVPLVSSLPSATTLALTGVFEPLGLERPPGYEVRFYDRDAGKIRGGGLLSYGAIEFSWREVFHWKTRSLLRKAIGYLRPIKLSSYEIRAGVEAFLESDQPVFLIYVGATDGVAHIKGPEGFAPVLRELDAVLEEAHRRQDFYTVILSDHGVGGGEPLRNVRREVMSALREGGYTPAKRLRDERDAVVVPFGLLSSLVAFTAPGEAARVAQVLAGVPGIAACAHRDPAVEPDAVEPQATLEHSRWWVVGPGGRARVEHQQDPPDGLWRYLPETGDPLDYGPLAGEWRSGREWLERTLDHRFPDGPHRIARAFDLVEHPASVVCSTAPGYQFGSALTEIAGRLGVGRLRWTHGALESADALGFFATDHPWWQPKIGVRFDRALDFLAPYVPSGLLGPAED